MTWVSSMNPLLLWREITTYLKYHSWSNQLLLTKTNFNRGAAGNEKKLGGLKDNTKIVGLESGKACRICLDDMEEEDNPFITPCKCAGSMRFIHLKCLREWLDSKRIAQKLQGVYSYYWEELSCELCKEPLSLSKFILNH